MNRIVLRADWCGHLGPVFGLGSLCSGSDSALVMSLPGALTQWMSQLATALMLLAVRALGVRTSLREMASIGWRPVILLGGEALLLAITIASLLLLEVG